MLSGTADLAALPTGAVPAWGVPGVELEGAEVVQAVFELRAAGREAVLPPALHPTNPPTAVLQGWRCPSSPWGPFQLAQLRVQCRSGLRPRGFVVGAVIDNPDAADGLGRGWGFAAAVGEARLRRSYDETVLHVALEGRPILSFTGRDPDPLGDGDVSYASTLNLAETPNGLRLVQLDVDVQPERVERLQPCLTGFDAESWGSPLLDPWYPVAASIAVGRAVLAPVRYCCRPDLLAFEGTETVS